MLVHRKFSYLLPDPPKAGIKLRLPLLHHFQQSVKTTSSSISSSFLCSSSIFFNSAMCSYSFSSSCCFLLYSLDCMAIKGTSYHVTLEDLKSFTESLHLSWESHLKVTKDIIYDTLQNVERFWREIQEIRLGQISLLDIVVLDKLLLTTTWLSSASSMT